MRNLRIPFTGLSSSCERKNALRDSIVSNKNIFELVSISAKLLLDASLRDSDPELLQNKLLINFIAALFFSLNEGKEDTKKCLLDMIHDEKGKPSDQFNQILTTIQCIQSLKSAQSRLLAFICLSLNAKKLIENIKYLICNKTKLLQFYSQNSFIFTDEIQIMLKFIDPINCTDFTIDIISMDFNDDIFLKIDLGFLFKSQMKLFSCYPGPLQDAEYPKLVIPDTLVMLKNQNVCLEQQYFEIKEKHHKLKFDFDNITGQLNALRFNVEEYETNLNQMIETNNELECSLEQNSQSVSEYERTLKHFKEIIEQRDTKIRELNNIANDRKNTIEALSINMEIVKNQLVQAKISIESLNESRICAITTLNAKNEAMRKLNEENETLRSENTEKGLAHAHLLAQLSSCEHAVNTKNLEIFDLNDQNQSLKERNSQLEEKFSQLEMTLEEMGNKLSTTTLQVDTYKEKVELTKISSWIDDQTVNKCQACNEPFSLSRRKHHCRKCGANKITVANDDTKRRVCDRCFTNALQIAI